MNYTRRPQVIFCLLLVILTACSKKPADNATQPNASGDQSTNQAAQPAPAPTPIPQPPPPPPPVVIPAGTVLTVRLKHRLGSKTSKEGDHFSATLAEPVVGDDGNPVVPAGSGASGKVTEAHAAGRFKGGASLGIVLGSLTIAGHDYQISTGPAAMSTKGKGKRTAAMVGGGAAGGALIGGIAGGGKGAAIGAVVGAGAGTAGAAFTGTKDIDLPAESALSFKMTQPLTLEPVSADPTQQSQPAQQ